MLRWVALCCCCLAGAQASDPGPVDWVQLSIVSPARGARVSLAAAAAAGGLGLDARIAVAGDSARLAEAAG